MFKLRRNGRFDCHLPETMFSMKLWTVWTIKYARVCICNKKYIARLADSPTHGDINKIYLDKTRSNKVSYFLSLTLLFDASQITANLQPHRRRQRKTLNIKMNNVREFRFL